MVPVPYDLTSTYQAGARRGPSAILDASANMELYDEELRKETYLVGIHTVDRLEPDARGPREMIESVHRVIADVLSQDKVPVMLGGDHSISLGAVRAMKEKYPAINVLQLDAHADMRDSYQGTLYSHAAVARRISELCPLVQAGIRSLSAEEASYMPGSGVESFSADFIHDDPGWIEKICGYLHGDIYLTIDVDVLDPAVMPATGTPEPGGITWRELLLLVREMSSRCRLRGFDVVELAPVPGLIAPDFLAAKLVYRIMGYITETKFT